jgi:glutathione S-transferase|tara:strand:+ start:2031 stop:2681 length:651 start_codon:yes stop_codon:yes gene_type:complete
MNYVKEFSSRDIDKPFLFSYRRCPYAMRARMAMLSANISFDAYEISLRDKPEELIKLSPKATVPVLLYNNKVIDESLDIMLWAYAISDESNHLIILSQHEREVTDNLITVNDCEFKKQLDAYKYEPNENILVRDDLFKKGLLFLESLEICLGNHKFLIGNRVSFADIAIFPFIRQFAHVDIDRFTNIKLIKTKKWFELMGSDELFLRAMIRPEFTN